MTSTDSAPTPGAPLLRVVRGNPTDEELAALVAVLTARAAAAVPPAVPEDRRLSPWVASAREPGVRTRASW